MDRLFRAIEKYGYILNHDLPPQESQQLVDAKNSGVLTTCDQIEATKSMINSGYCYTYADNRFNLKIKEDDRNSYIVKGVFVE
jgi:hypothetical protein